MVDPKTDANFGDAIEPIAVIGMACRFPGHVSSPEEFWDMLSAQRSGHSGTPRSRFNVGAFHHPDHDRKGAIQPTGGFFLEDDVSLFDAPFFSITAKEAMGMDPMQRQLLELSFECFENAGIPLEELSQSQTAVYTGVMTNDYERLSQADVFDLAQNAASGTSRAMLSNRLSWFFNLHGPSLTLDTACSSSLYALHLACQSLRLHEASQALVTGANLILHPVVSSQLSSMHMLSPDGVCHSFDDRANGYARGEACGAILVKPLSRALADNDSIRAVIRATGANQDGKTPGITMPSGAAQANLIRATYAAAGLPMEETSYFEAHGTGTRIGDPTELAAIGGSLGLHRATDRPLYVGSVKTNVGHTEGMAGLAGVIKTVLSLERATLPGLVNFQNLNPLLRLDEWNIALPLETMPWPQEGLRRASVNSFGFGGANAHAILDDALHYLESHGLQGQHRTVRATVVTDSEPESSKATKTSGPTCHKLLPFSMQDQAGLDRLSTSLSRYLSSDLKKGERSQFTMNDLAYTLSKRRSAFGFRSFAVAKSVEELAVDLKMMTSRKSKRLARPNNVVFVFTGQGAQWPLMGIELLAERPFQASVIRSQQYLTQLGATWDAIELLQDPGNRINEAQFTQPICTILQIALVDLLAAWGVSPRATVGHSSGEIAAAYAAGGVTHKDAVKIAYLRGYYCGLIQSRLKGRKGAMMAAGLTVQEAKSYIDQVANGSVVIGCINSPASVTLSGDTDGIAYLEKRIQLDGKFARQLKVEVAYHSPHMSSVSRDFLESMGKIETTEAFKVPMFSSVTTELLSSPSKLNAHYWVTNMVSPVRFSEAVSTLLSHSSMVPSSKRKTKVNWSVAVELGPHEALNGPFTQCLAAMKDTSSNKTIPYTSLLRRGQAADKSAREAAGLLWSLGYDVNLCSVNNLNDGEVRHQALTCLPPYPWQHGRGFWHEAAASTHIRQLEHPRTDLLGCAVERQNPHEMIWKNHLRLSENPWMRDHAITGTILYPAAGMMVMAIEAALKVASELGMSIRGIEMHDVHFDRGLVVPEGEAVEVSLSMRPHERLSSWFHWTIYSFPPSGSWTKHCFGLLALVEEGRTPRPYAEPDAQWHNKKQRFAQIKDRAKVTIDPANFYSQLESVGMGYGPTFTNVTSAAATNGEQTGYGTITIPDSRSTMPSEYEYPHLIHPATLDAIFHLIYIALFEGKPMGEAAIPVTMEKMFVAKEQPVGAGTEFAGFSSATKINDRDASGSLVVSDVDWQTAKVEVTNLVVRKVSESEEAFSASLPGAPKRVAQLSWKPDIDMLDRAASESLMLSNASQERFNWMSPLAAQASAWLDLACHKRADLNVLTIVDKVSTARTVVEILSLFGPCSGRDLRFQRCTVLATSEDALYSIKEQELMQKLSLQYEVLDLENMPTKARSQTSSLFDIVIADSKYTHEVMEIFTFPGSRLLDLDIDPEAEENIKAGMSYVTLAQLDEGDCRISIKQRADQFELSMPTVVYLLEPLNRSKDLSRLSENLVDVFAKNNVKVESRCLEEAINLKRETVVCLLEAESPFVMTWTAEDFDLFRRFVMSQSYILWVTTAGVFDSDEDSLQYAPTIGLLRTLRAEYPQVVLPHLDLSGSSDLSSLSTGQKIFDVFKATSKSEAMYSDMEMMESNGAYMIPRAVADNALDEQLNMHSSNPIPVLASLSNHRNRPLKLSRGDTEVHSYWTDDTEASAVFGEEMVEIKVAHTAFRSTDTAAHTWNDLSSHTASGEVLRTGASVRNIGVGDKVLFPLLGTTDLKTHVRQDQSLVFRLEEGLGLQDAAPLPLMFLPAIYYLKSVARVLPKDRVLIHLKESSDSHAAVQVARSMGLEVFVTAASQHDKEQDRYGVPYDHTFLLTASNLAHTLDIAGGGEGFDLVICDYTGELRRFATLCIAENGHFVDVSASLHPSDLSAGLLKRNITFSTVDFHRVTQAKHIALFQQMAEMLQSGSITAPPTTIPNFSISALDAAEVFSASRTGLIATVSFVDAVPVPMLPPKPKPLALDPKASYVISGGLGALGLAIANNMAKWGARHLVLLSRSGITTSRQQAAVEQLRELGCKVDAIRCDVTREAQVADLMSRSRDNGWIFKGAIQSAVVLRDSIFENMPYERWLEVIQPKIDGTWNLHSYLPDDLDFFVILSSMSGIIGNAGQANYAAGNTFVDSLAHFRRARGLKATTLNVGMVTDDEQFHSDLSLEEYLKLYGHWASAAVTNEEVQIAIETAMRGTTADGQPVPVQLLVGITDKVPRNDFNPWSKDRKFDHRIEPVTTFVGLGTSKNIADKLAAAETAQEAVALVESSLRGHVAAAMTASPDDIDAEKPLYSFGIDSLKAMQVRNWIFKELKADVSVFDILSPVPLVQLAASVARKSSLVTTAVAAMIEQESG